MQLTIKKLRQAGFKVRVIHTRHYEQLYPDKMSRTTILSCKGGSTTLQITTPDKQVNVEAVAKCSLEDSFNRKLGNSIALGRAVSKLVQFEHIKELLEKL